ncbi:MAG TPA: hypothetical protein VGU45_12685 [Microvirga sp.]|nr:hypothetical protein [Microvirga sp.]
MPHMIAALFRDYATAQQALQAMMGAGVARDRIAIVGESPGREVSSISGFRELSARDDVMAELHDLPLPDEDLQAFEGGLRQGHVLISARVERENMNEAINVIEMFDPLDMDGLSESRSKEVRLPRASAADLGGPLGAGITAGGDAGQTNTPAMPGMGSMTDRTDDLGSADLRTDETSTGNMGLSSTTATEHRRAEERAGRPGVMEMDQSPDAGLATKMAPGIGGTASAAGNAKPDLFRRDSTRMGRVRAYSRD